jgi:hypothetical protein
MLTSLFAASMSLLTCLIRAVLQRHATVPRLVLLRLCLLARCLESNKSAAPTHVSKKGGRREGDVVIVRHSPVSGVCVRPGTIRCCCTSASFANFRMGQQRLTPDMEAKATPPQALDQTDTCPDRVINNPSPHPHTCTPAPRFFISIFLYF